MYAKECTLKLIRPFTFIMLKCSNWSKERVKKWVAKASEEGIAEKFVKNDRRNVAL